MVEGGARHKKHRKSPNSLSNKTVEQLRKMAKKKHIKLSHNGVQKKKASLVAALRK